MTVDVAKAQALINSANVTIRFLKVRGYVEAAATIAALLAERDALARDAARYQWLRANEDGVSYCVTHDGNTGATVYMAGDELDAAIDAAMKGASDE